MRREPKMQKGVDFRIFMKNLEVHEGLSYGIMKQC